MAGPLPPETVAELTALAARYGEPRVVHATLEGRFADPIRRPDRIGEVCMVIRRPTGRVLLCTKTFYPPGAYRLPTGGIDRGEGVFDALLRETSEETGLDVAVRRFLARISYRLRQGPAETAPPSSSFHTFAFLLDEAGGTLAPLDPREQLLDYREVMPAELPAVADRLAALRDEDSDDIVGSWRDWGEFRAIVHRVVHDAL